MDTSGVDSDWVLTETLTTLLTDTSLVLTALDRVECLETESETRHSTSRDAGKHPPIPSPSSGTVYQSLVET